MCLIVHIRGLSFKFVDFFYSRSEVFNRVINVIPSENIFFSLSFDIKNITLQFMVSTQQHIVHIYSLSPGARYGEFNVK